MNITLVKVVLSLAKQDIAENLLDAISIRLARHRRAQAQLATSAPHEFCKLCHNYGADRTIGE
ncbi:MAG: hypothetical protein K8F33_03165 [Thermomonas sp.]|nr:hypothetical protein [Thermomonas sp.]